MLGVEVILVLFSILYKMYSICVLIRVNQSPKGVEANRGCIAFRARDLLMQIRLSV